MRHMEFEVAAMADGSKFIGSIRWGFKIGDDQKSALDPADIVIGDAGQASTGFFAAASKWNSMEVPGRGDGSGEKLSPMQLSMRKGTLALDEAEVNTTFKHQIRDLVVDTEYLNPMNRRTYLYKGPKKGDGMAPRTTYSFEEQ